MINQMRADFYRQAHTIGCYVLLAATIGFSVLLTLTKQVGGMMVSEGNTSQLMEQMAHSPWSVLTGVKALTMSTSVLLYFDIALFVIVIGYEFSQKTYKNTLISGISRLQFIGAKYAVMLIDLLGLTLVYYLTCLATSLATGRGLGESAGKLAGDIAIMTIAVAFFISVTFSLGIILLVATGSTIIPAVFVVVWPLAVAMLTVFAHWSWLKYVDFINVAMNVALSLIKVGDLWPYIGVSVGVLAVTIVGSALIIRRKEL
ncbi:ABC transporter permease [Bifidobacterium xylocopae]|uniref:ABC transporter permease n=1 Tax=Bifidobacterium xylocopae TaxID=2493119 RepID=A0A366KEA7_9BIFI|nr:ABC transporter permease [Bifidobacterium xylocopae]RBP99909.1 ABC transporter permease [Bifidobacterium xylocopae]